MQLTSPRKCPDCTDGRKDKYRCPTCNGSGWVRLCPTMEPGPPIPKKSRLRELSDEYWENRT